jgi:hypothetical protein
MHDVDCTSILRRFVSVACKNQTCAYFDISGDTVDETWSILNTKLTADLFGDGKIALQPEHF